MRIVGSFSGFICVHLRLILHSPARPRCPDPGHRSQRLCSPDPHLHPRRHAPRQHHPGAGVVGRHLLRPARQTRPLRQHGPGPQRHHVQDHRQVPRDADRPAGAAASGQRDAGRSPAPVPAGGERLLRAPGRPAARRRDGHRHRVLRRAAEGRAEPAVGRRVDLGTGAGGRALDQRGLPGARRQRVVAEQRHASGRARQPAGRAHRARLAPGPRQRAASRRRVGTGGHHLRVVRLRADQQLRRVRVRGPVRTDERDVHG